MKIDGFMEQDVEPCCTQNKMDAPESSPGSDEPRAPLGLISSAKATMHCLTGCTIGEVLGLLIGVSLQWPPLYTIALCVLLAFAVGFYMAISSIMANEGLSFMGAFRAVWLGEVISMGIMEIVMNWVDYSVGGMSAASVFTPAFLLGLGLAIPAGFLAAWPVNYWLLSKEIKNCCH